MKLCLAIIFFVCVGRTLSTETDYCAFPCKAYHIACKHSPTDMQPSCPAGAKQIVLDEVAKHMFLELINKCRDELASGILNFARFPAAAKMPMVTWDDDLATVAGYNVRRCLFAHDDCRSTTAFSDPGQNLLLYTDYTEFKNVLDIIPSAVNVWFNEYEKTPVDIVHSFYEHCKMVGHFTQLIEEKTVKMGCAISEYQELSDLFLTLIACNFSHMNVYDEPVYTTGKPCSQCSNGCSANYTSLCN